MATRLVGQYTDIDTYRVDIPMKCDLTAPSADTTMAASDVHKLVKVTTAGDADDYPTCALAGDGDVIYGYIRNIEPDGALCTVQKTGIIRVPYTGDDPTVGTIMSIVGSDATDGYAVFAAAAAGKRQCLILDVDSSADPKEAEIELL